MRRYGFAFTLACLCVCISANSRLIAATMITSDDDPLLDDAVVITFDEVPLGTQDPTIRGVSFVGLSVPLDVNSRNTIYSPPILTNQTNGSFGTSFDIFLPDGVTSFGTFFFGVNFTTTLEAFNDKQEFLGFTELFADFAPVNGFRGLATDVPIRRVRVTTTDFFHIDDFHVVFSIPEPSTLSLLAFAISITWPYRSRSLV